MIKEIKQFFIDNDQSHLISELSSFSHEEIKYLFNQIHELKKHLVKCDFFYENKQVLDSKPLKQCEHIDSFSGQLGKESIKNNKIGCVLLAAGQGTRLGFDHPKGMFLISPVKQKSLFQIFSEKILFAQEKYKIKLYCALMVSDTNEKETKKFFVENKFFGLEEDQLIFFNQGIYPFLNEEEKWFYECNGKIAVGPDGNGSFYTSFFNKVYQKFKRLNIDTVSVVSVDNPLADPFDEKMISSHKKEKNDVTIKCINNDEKKKIGLLSLDGKKIKIVEYLHVNEKQREEYFFANTGIYLISMNFIKYVSKISLPFHKSLKKSLFFRKNEKKEIYYYKCERFIFDAFDYANNVQAILCDKESSYAPLKNKTGEDSIQTVKKAIIDNHRSVVKKLFGKSINKNSFELSYNFYYPTDNLIKRWENVNFDDLTYMG